MLRSPRKLPRRIPRTATGLLTIVALFVAAPAFGQQKFSPETANDLVTDVSVIVSPGTQIQDPRDTEREYGSLGIQKCRELMDDDDPQITFQFQFNQNYNGTIDIDDQFLMELSSSTGFQGTCEREGDRPHCSRIRDSHDEVRITPAATTINPRTQTTFEIQMPFDLMLEWHDGVREACTFASNSSGPRDAGGLDGGSDSGTTGSSASGDHVFSARVLLTGDPTRIDQSDQQEDVDAAFELDRSRPPAPSDLLARAITNKIKVRFDAPQDQNEIEGYHVFYSTGGLPTSSTPEALLQQDDVERLPLTSTSEEGNSITGTVSSVDLPTGSNIDIAVASRDEAKNFSTLARTEDSTRVANARDFPPRYRDLDGSESGGCGCSSAESVPAAAVVLVLALFAVGGLRFRRRFR